jgi:formylglycine-generating enzyme required for sulfatase activity
MDSWAAIPGGRFLMGSDGPEAHPEEAPVREVEVAAFELDAVAVTNTRFAAFVADTGHRTDAERFGWSFVFKGFVAEGTQVAAAVAAPWWLAVQGATWNAPEGPGTTVAGREDHPVVHVSQHDARAYCDWAGCRLPTEEEWEFAARDGLAGQPFPWGGELAPGGEWRCNVWQGTFPDEDTGEDGYRGTAPVDSFPPTAFGLHNLIGNVWEWTTGATRGGSYLCHASYCNRYRTSARSLLTPDSSCGNLGFRCAR